MHAVTVANIEHDATWLALKEATFQDLVNTIPAADLNLEVEKVALKELCAQVQGATQMLGWQSSSYPNGKDYRVGASKTARLCRLLASALEHSLNQSVVTEES